MPIAYDKEDEAEWLELKDLIMSRFRMKDLGECRLILGMRVTRNYKQGTLVVDNEIHIRRMLAEFGMGVCTPAPTPESLEKLLPTTEEERGKVDITLFQKLAGSLNYLAQASRPDISHAVNVVCRFASDPSLSHFKSVKRIFRYLAGTASLGLTYSGGDTRTSTNGTPRPSDPVFDIITYTDADWGGDLADRKSTTGYAVRINSCTVAWRTCKQRTVALSTAEAEYMAISGVLQEIIRIRSILTEILGANSISPRSIILCDNQAATSISKDDKHHQRTKHIDIKHHFIRQHVKNGDIAIKWTPTSKQTADILTKGLPEIKFKLFRHSLMNSRFKYQDHDDASGGVLK